MSPVAVYVGIIAAPALLALVVYFIHDFLEKLELRFKRIEAKIDSFRFESSEQISNVKHSIDIVVNDDSKKLMIEEYHIIKDLFAKQSHDLTNKMLEVRDLKYFVERHEKALAKAYQIIKSQNNQLQDIYKTLRNKS